MPMNLNGHDATAQLENMLRFFDSAKTSENITQCLIWAIKLSDTLRKREEISQAQYETWIDVFILEAQAVIRREVLKDLFDGTYNHNDWEV